MKKILLIIGLMFLTYVGFSQIVTPCDTAFSPTSIYIDIQRPVVAGQIVHVHKGCDPDAGQILTWSIIGDSKGFKINPSTGELSVNDATIVNNSTSQTVSFVIRLTDNETVPQFDEATDYIVDKNTAPVILAQTFNVNENTANGSLIGTVVASDVNTNQTLKYSIVSGNVGSPFSLDVNTGKLTVLTSSTLNYEYRNKYDLVIKVQDNGFGSLSSQATITVNVNNVNEPPKITDQTFIVN